MDGDSHLPKKHDHPGYQTGSGARQHPARHLSGSSADRFRQQEQHEPARGLGTDGMIAQDRASTLSVYGGYGYTESPSYGNPSLQSGTLQSGGLQYQPNYSSSSSSRNQQQQRLSQYGGEMVYNMPQAQPQSPYEGVSHYQPRHSPAIDVLGTQFGGPQYFQAEGPAAAAGSDQYLTASHVQPTPYSQAAPLSRAATVSTLPEIMVDLQASTAPEGLGHTEFPHESPSSFDDAYNQYQQALRQTFENARSGRLVDASQSLLELSAWLLGNATELGLARDEEELHPDRIKLWNEFNTCWLAVCQKQKDMTQEMLESGLGTTPQNLLTEDILNKMGRELVRLCDRMEQYGLVDYQMGVWEEEILSVLSQCLDLLEGNENTPASENIARTTTSAAP
ncbi:hypothetical protein AJ78_02372 [Emergomyces pasteurianus Ep9510]|uniref:Uncharacterized protein n=1 Tax=Emergomyces pasteurianus Ep9510 TaxID=1447872 RepID=A0A1J9QN11_9EURO|nr:hypothetical protein AJ78_02372 [Emergomyces pasteurianus Ep9510]